MSIVMSGIVGVHGHSKHSSDVPQITSETYTGSSAANRAIPHGLGSTPKLVVIQDITSYRMFFVTPARIKAFLDTSVEIYAVTAMDATNFYVGNATSYTNSANVNTSEYTWFALY